VRVQPKVQNVDRFVVGTENDAWSVFHQAQGCTEKVDTVLSRWPIVTVTLNPGDGSATPQLRRCIDKIQRYILRNYAVLKYGDPDARQLTLYEREELALSPLISKGSTKVAFDLSRVLTLFGRALANRMTGGQATFAMISAALILGTTAGTALFYYFDADARKEEARAFGQHELALAVRTVAEQSTHQIRMVVEQESRHVEQLKAAYEKVELVRQMANINAPWRPAILGLAPPGGTITINGVTIPSSTAKSLAKTLTARAKSEKLAASPQKVGKQTAPLIESAWTTKTVVTPVKQS
jgi:hypothetical protein